MGKHFSVKVSALAAEEEQIQKKKEILYNQRILNMRIKKSFFADELRKSYKFIQILLKENEEMKKKFQLYEEGPEPYHFEHQKDEPSNEIKAEVNEEQTESEELDLHLSDDEDDLINNINLEIQ